jgi:uncharacterized protein
MKLSQKQKSGISEIAKKYDLKSVIVFGSFASGKNRKDSDLDLAISGHKKISFSKQIKLISIFSSIFRKDVDLTIIDNANPLLLFEISKNSILISGSKKDFACFQLNAFKIFHDYTPYFEMERKLNKKLINAYAR